MGLSDLGSPFFVEEEVNYVPKNKPTELTAKQQAAIHFMVWEEHLTQNEVAEKAGCSPQTLSRWKRDSLFIDELNKETRRRWDGYYTRAVKEAEKIMVQDENLSVKNDMVKFILKSNGIKEEQTVNINSDGSFNIVIGFDDEHDND